MIRVILTLLCDEKTLNLGHLHRLAKTGGSLRHSLASLAKPVPDPDQGSRARTCFLASWLVGMLHCESTRLSQVAYLICWLAHFGIILQVALQDVQDGHDCIASIYENSHCYICTF